MDWIKLRGIVAVYKPVGPTSHDVIDQLRRLTGERRIGHAGTLDPLASGVLVVGIGREATKHLEKEVQKEKEYIADIMLGVESTTDDAEGDKRPHDVKMPPDEGVIRTVLTQFVGNIQQVPPAYSAVKKGGKKAYQAARAGKPLQLEARTVEVKGIEVLSYDWPSLKLRVVTGPGVYIRSLARDIGAALAVGGYLQGLERTKVGAFSKEKTLLLPATDKQHKS